MDLQGPVLYNTFRRAFYFMSVFGRKAGNMKKEGNLDFTVRAKESFLGAVKDPYFRDRDSGVIFDLLRSGLRIVPFGDYLKRYIYRKAELQGDYAEIPVSVYQEILCEEFRERQVPCSFTPSSLRLRNAAKNWLEQQAVNRQVVLLLGFGLGMDAGDVDMFLTKALQEYGLDAKDPFEALCLYCYRNRLGYPKFEELWEAFRAAGDGEGLPAAGGGNLDFTVRAKESFLEAVKDPYFRDRDCDVIFDLLRSGMRIVPFGDYLKRYIYRKAELRGNYAEIPVSVYQEIICEEFRDRQVPCSFTPSSLRLRNAAKNWLEQQAVNRQVVLLLGFGLGMDAGDVDMFLTKALQEYGLDAKDPFEALCLYCYRNRLG